MYRLEARCAALKGGTDWGNLFVTDKEFKAFDEAEAQVKVEQEFDVKNFMEGTYEYRILTVGEGEHGGSV